MGKYYYLIFGLPNIALDDGKLAYSVRESRAEIENMLSSEDKRLIDLFYLEYDNINLLAHVKRPDSDPDQRGRITYDEFNTLYKALEDEGKIPKSGNLSPCLMNFFKLYLTEEAKDTKNKKEYISWGGRLAALYYEHAIKCGNKFVADWFKLNLNINNVLTAITCRKCGFDKTNYIVGHNEIAEDIHMSDARDFGLGDPVEYLSELQRIVEEIDLIVREKKTDPLRWKWLDDSTFFETFDIESVFVYLLKLEMIERWVALDKAGGEKTPRELVGIIKMDSENVLEKFRKSNIK